MLMDGDDQNQDAPTDAPQGGGMGDDMGGEQPVDSPAAEAGDSQGVPDVPAQETPETVGDAPASAPEQSEPEAGSIPSGEDNNPTG